MNCAPTAAYDNARLAMTGRVSRSRLRRASLLLITLAVPFFVFPVLAQEPATRIAMLCMHSDELLYDTQNNRIVAQGNVQIQFNTSVIKADRVTYEQPVN